MDIQSGHSVKRTEFDDRMAEIINNDPDWEIINRPNNPLNVSNISPVNEPLLKKYRVTVLTRTDAWGNVDITYQLPTSIKLKIPISSKPTDKDIKAKAIKAIAESPPAKPSNPSVKLTALLAPTKTNKIAKP